MTFVRYLGANVNDYKTWYLLYIFHFASFFQKLCVSMYFEMILFNFIRKGVHIWFYLISTPQVKACTHMNDIRVFNCFRYIVAWYAMGFRGLQIPSLHLSINDWNHAKNYNHWRFLRTLMLEISHNTHTTRKSHKF